MGHQLVWNDQYKIGIKSIDKEHEKLFHILNRLFESGQQEKKSQWVCREAVKYFKDHALQHFRNEEEYMNSIQYAGYKVHKRIHDNFRERMLPALEQELELTNYSAHAVDHFLGICARWLVGHTLSEDQAIGTGERIHQWEQLLTEEEQAVMGQTVIHWLHSMFQLNSHLISSCYSGEKFGDGIYYRLIYSTKEKKNLEFLLVFEEQLLVNIIGGVMDSKAKTVNAMLINVARYTAKQFLEYMKRYFPVLAQAKVSQEQILTYEQFQKVFEKRSPQFSLLFDTGKGYFAYCMTTGDLLIDEDGISILTENAIIDLEKHLNQNQTKKIAISKKKKILVVDDSDFMLIAMRQLLGGDYEVMTATSGLSAFRSIALEQPDLVLLDYEMPVCNGSQVLEMIRFEKGFADIPVIFLTGRVDKESVEKVLELKPQGYLSKSLSPEQVKTQIDLFFSDE